MRLPTIHLNGTDAQSLFDNYYAALHAVLAAKEALAQCAPNGRDYYVQKTDSGDWTDAPTNEAIAEHRARMAALETIQRDLQTLCEYVMDNSNGKVRS